jgi:hypothetical protein
LRLGSRPKEIDQNSGLFVIPGINLSRSNAIQKAIDDYGRIGGRDKGGSAKSILFSPAEEDLVMPELFVMRWLPLKRNCLATLSIENSDRNVLWQQENVDTSSGKLVSAEARQALASYRVTNKAALRFGFVACGNTEQSFFTVMLLEQENSLKAELKTWESDSSMLLKHIGRAAIFNHYRLRSLAADEYEAALAVAPYSRDLLQRTVDAQREIGNLARVQQLEKQLARLRD